MMFEIELLNETLNIMKEMAADICVLESSILKLAFVVLLLSVWVLYLNYKLLKIERKVDAK